MDSNEMTEYEMACEIYEKLAALDEALGQVFKSHTPYPIGPDVLNEGRHEVLRAGVLVMRNLESTMDSLKSQNPMVLMKSLMGL